MLRNSSGLSGLVELAFGFAARRARLDDVALFLFMAFWAFASIFI
jgi:hypothetical protein